MSAEGHVNGLYRIVSSNQFHLNSLAAKVGNNDDARIELQFEEVDHCATGDLLFSAQPLFGCWGQAADICCTGTVYVMHLHLLHIDLSVFVS